ncbi:MAG: flagellar FlbD family protein [Bryobacterales bacterium]
MIGLTKLNGRAVVVNADLIETIESTPDTVISLVTGKKFVVLESADSVVDKVICYRRKAVAAPPLGVVLTALDACTASQHED